MAIGIIAEYNPFHNGHKKQLAMLREKSADPIVATMSGSITQRGELAILDKWQRAKCAVANGVSLVLELPFHYACASAPAFAAGGVGLLASLGIVDKLAFGTEYPDIDLLQSIAHFPTHEHWNELMALVNTGISFGEAESRFLGKALHLSPDLLREPNTILAIEYLRALHLHPNKNIEPLPLPRIGTGHNATHTKDNFASGTQLRRLILAKLGTTSFNAKNVSETLSDAVHELNTEQAADSMTELASFVPPATFEAIQAATSYPAADLLLPLLKWQLLRTDVDELKDIYGMREGLEYKFKESTNAESYIEFVQNIATRRYPATRIQRTIMYILQRITHEYMDGFDLPYERPLYLRVLAFDERGRELLRKIKAHTDIPIITKVSDNLNRRDLQHTHHLTPLQRMLLLDVNATNLRELCAVSIAGTPTYHPRMNLDLTTSPYYHK